MNREPDEIPKRVKEIRDYNVGTPIGGAEYLEVPADDIRWESCRSGDLPPSCPLPVVFFEVIAKRLAKTDDLRLFLKNIPLPISIRRYFHGSENEGRLEQYINQLLSEFPAIITRAGWLLDQDALADDFVIDFEKEDLRSFYSKRIQSAPARDVPVIGAALSKLEGWDAPDKLAIAQVSEVRHVLDDITASQRLTGDNFCPLPPPIDEG